MKSDELIFRLRRMKPNREMCEGCGLEHNCTAEGCALGRAAADFIEAAMRDMVLAIKNDCAVCATPCSGNYPPDGNFLRSNTKTGSTCANWRWRGVPG